MDKYNVGIVGLGWPGERHAEGVQGSGLGDLYAACDINEERREKFTAKYSPEKVFVSYDEMLADPGLDAVIVSLPNALHFPGTLKALQASKHVLCEKPPTLNAGQMRQLHAEAEQRGLIYFFGRQMRFSGAVQAARKAVAERRLGDIYFAKTMWVRSRGTPGGVDGWFTDRSRAGGGALIDLGVHAIDAAWYLMGNPKPRTVSAQTYQKFPQLVKAAVFDVEDSACGMIRFENGASVLFEVSWSANLTDDIPIGRLGTRELFSTTLFGPKGSIRVVDTLQLHPSVKIPPLSLFEDKDGELVDSELPFAPVRHEFVSQMQNFLRAIRGDEAALNSSVQAVLLMEMLDAIYKSSLTGREVSLSYL
ncbi:MAG: Gfo/Idh/MocA family oxidoreductase [Verrucomicrobia bacterium]|nr:Gfo/Idh/MocA family oxidoreductase [Verrucomicrobiota bacterium]MBV8377648.1 Gfo/Idh/MocA family oxidoreductase [Verrucomicrobiota bacterium]